MKKHFFVFFCLVTLSLFRPLFVDSYASFEIDADGYVTYVVDGDTLDVSNFGRIRLADINTPESDEAGYYEAKNYLSSLVYEKFVYIDKDENLDYWGRFVCVVYVRWNTTHLLNVNKDLLDKQFAVIKHYDNEFDPSTWTLYVYDPIYVPKLSTTISCSSSLSEINVGSSVTISGAISPYLSMRTVTLTYKKPDGSTFYRTTLTNSYGSYSDTYTVSALGSWSVMGSWEGDSTYNGATSSLTSFIGTKIVTSLSCTVSSSKINEGDSVIVSGVIFPSVSDVTVTLTYTKPDNSIFTRTCTTNLGDYSDTYTPDMLGSWKVSASWIGDATHEGASSSSKAFTVSKLSSSLSCSISFSSIMIGDSVTVSGSLIPALSDKVVTLTYTKPDGLMFTRTCTTNNGDYSDTYTPDMVGSWRVSASWVGDITHEGASTSSKLFTVSKLSSGLSCSISSSDLIVGDSVTISGSILTISGIIPPPQIGIPITLSDKSDGVWSTLTTVTSTTNGNYSYTWTPPSVASYQLKASWDGDGFFTGATSNEVSVTVRKMSTSVSCSVSSTTITRGESINVSGTIDPLLSDITIILTYTKPEGSLFTITVTTGSDGSFIDSFPPDADGSWSVKASWDGDSTYKDASSSEVHFTVNTSLIGGPGWIEEIVLIGGIGIALVSVFIFLRVKNSKHSIWR